MGGSSRAYENRARPSETAEPRASAAATASVGSGFAGLILVAPRAATPRRSPASRREQRLGDLDEAAAAIEDGHVGRPLLQPVGEVGDVGDADRERKAGKHQLVVGRVADVQPVVALGVEVAAEQAPDDPVRAAEL